MDEDKKVEFCITDFKNKFVEESSLVVNFPGYRKGYIEKTSKYIINALAKYKLTGEINLDECEISVKTNSNTRDPYIFVKGTDFVRLVAKGVEIENAAKVFEDNVFSDIISISKTVRNKEIFEKRRDRLIGPNGSTLKALKLLTGCYILVCRKFVCVIGDYNGICTVQDVVMKCMANIHPVYEIKILIEKKKLSEDPAMKNEDWDRLLPKIKKKNQKHSSKPKSRKTGGMPVDPPKSKLDIAIETGEYFIDEPEKSSKGKKNEDKFKKYEAPEE